jgi:hypothetical protein
MGCGKVKMAIRTAAEGEGCNRLKNVTFPVHHISIYGLSQK